MDVLGLIYYAVVCGGLALVLERIPGRLTRLVVGLATGLVAASVLPIIKTLI